ncbi:hypothetical protein DYB32_002546 [Aphanomyces invadans]|uniref:non-specific serine/threonine protein kinase n=1 Tax=Aphanomyces invadans TaxID=157072 RepID=A0A418B335_9STRA|nr:hypothetical protein DYB32_002546 [Aphanomyces invadans]
MRTAASCRRLWTLPIVYLMVYVLERVSGRSDTNEDDVSSTEIHLTTPRGRERAVLLVGQMSGQLIAFDAWTGEIINSINSGGALVSNCRTDIMQDLHSDGSLSASLQPSARQKNNVATSISLQTPEKAFDQHNFAPTMDGRLYHLSEHDGEWKEVFLSTSRLLQSKKPLRAKDNPELSNVVFVAEKQQRLFTFDADTGQMYPFFSADATAAATAFSNTVSTEQPSTVLMGRVDVTTKMVNLHDVLDFKCVTVSEYFVQFAATAQCDVEKTPESTGTPWIEMEMSAESNVVSLAGYDPDSRRILWKWNSHVDLTMVYGVLPKQGIKFFQWDVALPVGVDDAESATQSLDRDDDDVVDSTCPTPPPLAPSKSSSVQATASSAVATIHRSPRPNLLYRHIDGQPYLLPSPKDLSPADSTFLDNGTTKNNAMSGHSIVVKRHQQQRPWNFKTVEIDGEKGVVLTSKHVVSIVLAVAVVVMLVAYVFYRKGLIAKPDSPSPQERDRFIVQAWLEELGEDEVVPAMSDAGGSYVTTANYTRRDGAGTSSEYSARNMLQRHSFDEKKFANDDEDMSTDSLYAPRRFSGQRDNDGDDEDSGGFVWDREGGDNASMEQWSEQDLYKDDSTVSVRRSATRNTTMQRYSRRPRGEKATTATSVVPLIDHWLYIQMQYCSEQCLADVLLAPGRRNYSHMLEMFFQIASALEHVHSLGLIHRDLKPQNIFVMDSDTIKLGDFGLSRYAGGGNSSSDGMDPPTVPLSKQDSSTWSMDDEKTVGVGTYLYASPEQISGETYNAKADMYSLGMILFEMMHEPFGTTMERVVTLRNLREGNLPPCWLQDHPPVVSMVTSLVTTCPSDRPSAFDVVTWCQTQLHLKSSAKNGSTSNNNHHKTHDDNVHVLQVEAVEWDNSTVCHNLLLALCDVIRAMPSVVIVACGLKQHMSYGQVLEFTLHVDTNQVLAQVQDAIAAAEGVKHVELLS